MAPASSALYSCVCFLFVSDLCRAASGQYRVRRSTLARLQKNCLIAATKKAADRPPFAPVSIWSSCLAEHAAHHAEDGGRAAATAATRRPAAATSAAAAGRARLV